MTTRALVVGGTGGIGFAMASRIAAEASSSTVIISGRTKPKVIPHSNMEFRPLDASSMHQIKQYTNAFKSTPGQELDFLIMTQSILTMAGRTETPEGIDRKMALNYYGRQLLLRELLPVLKKDAKVIIVLDARFGSPNRLDWDDLDLKKHYSLSKAANHCMVMNDAMVQYHAAQQQQRQDGAQRHFVHAYPGAVNTDFANKVPWYLKHIAAAAGHVLATKPDDCAKYLLTGTAECALAGNAEGRFWSCLNQKGHLVADKLIWSEEQLQKIADHTWGVVDGAAAKSSS
ncbi:hypothetical protein B0J13DRAFT_520675 [Dactylonectria estremocensis]|uniref:Uncharacterized protein n=1 Tax=Dactylonectria estremocensis TaxID=1079267 RepID=A0A9P9FCQ0_9HYPO|nr:hypothetical protein B0J13DRAFT_520675 [Dactylonectria estremocensis]